MKNIFLFKVEEAFQISGRGCVIVPGVPPGLSNVTIKVGSSIRLIKPNGEELDTTVAGVELINYGARRPTVLSVPIMLAQPVTKQDVPSGTQVFLITPTS